MTNGCSAHDHRHSLRNSAKQDTSCAAGLLSRRFHSNCKDLIKSRLPHIARAFDFLNRPVKSLVHLLAFQPLLAAAAHRNECASARLGSGWRLNSILHNTMMPRGHRTLLISEAGNRLACSQTPDSPPPRPMSLGGSSVLATLEKATRLLGGMGGRWRMRMRTRE